MDSDSNMFSEAAEAPKAVARQGRETGKLVERLAARLRALKPHLVVTAARGSSDNAASYAKYLIETRLGIPVCSAGLSVNSVYGAPVDLHGAVVLAISQSGRSPDLLRVLDNAKRSGAFTIAMVNAQESPLAAGADEAFPLWAGDEHSVAATKSFISTQVAIANLVARWSNDVTLIRALYDLPERLAVAWNLDWSAALPYLVKAHHLYVVGRGVGLAAAQEIALKLKEICALHAEAISAAEIQHGPIALAGMGFPALLLSQADETRSGIVELIGRLADQKTQMLLAGFTDERALGLPTSNAHPALQPILFIQSFYRLAESLARARTFDPDTPRYLSKITCTV